MVSWMACVRSPRMENPAMSSNHNWYAVLRIVDLIALDSTSDMCQTSEAKGMGIHLPDHLP